MTMEAKMIFSTDYWHNKLTDAQRNKLKDLKAKAKAQNHNNSPVSQNYNNKSSETQPAPVVNPNSGICNMLFNSTSRTPSSAINTCNCTYSVNQHKQRISGALTDGGANGGLSGSDVRVISETLSSANVTGIGEKSLSNLPRCTVGAVIQTNQDPIIGIFNQYVHYGKGQTIHSVNQLKHFGIIVDDTPRQFGHGKQRLETPEGYFISISIRNGLPYIDMYPPSDKELDSYPHVHFTSDMPWNPQVLDDEYDVQDLELSEDEFVSPSYHPDT
jgi:hypothetical protein